MVTSNLIFVNKITKNIIIKVNLNYLTNLKTPVVILKN
jgi:hypothetical protein